MTWELALVFALSALLWQHTSIEEGKEMGNLNAAIVTAFAVAAIITGIAWAVGA